MVLASPVAAFRSRKLRKRLLVSVTPQAEVGLDHSDTLSSSTKPLKWDEYCMEGDSLLHPRLTGESEYTTTTATTSSSTSAYDSYYNVSEDPGKPKKKQREYERKTGFAGLFEVAKSAFAVAADGFLKLGMSWGFGWSGRGRGYARREEEIYD